MSAAILSFSEIKIKIINNAILSPKNEMIKKNVTIS